MPFPPDRDGIASADVGRMATVLAHELRNPLAAVRGALQIVDERVSHDPANSSVIKQAIARIDSLDELVEDLLLFVTTPPLTLTSVDLNGLVRESAQFLLHDTSLAGCEVDVRGVAPAATADAALLRTVFQHLLLNAAQAMRGRGVIVVRLSQSSDGSAQVEIADDGPGFSDLAQEHLFEPFFTSKARGSGLGLPMAKRLIGLHQGTLTVESRQEGGAVVTVTLPAASASAVRQA